MSNNNKPEWMNDPLVQNIAPEKLEFLQAMVFEGNKMSRDQMMPFLISLAKRGRDKSVTFTDTEMDTVITVLKKYSTPEELDKINKVMALRRKH
ncbi:MAG: hypothetical protein LBV33_02115 [Lachnospiraceae bacterium]|jgi:hypothetical protein|nr:hypothetical protein [Lachnospiraceae bacterium]